MTNKEEIKKRWDKKFCDGNDGRLYIRNEVGSLAFSNDTLTFILSEIALAESKGYKKGLEENSFVVDGEFAEYLKSPKSKEIIDKIREGERRDTLEELIEEFNAADLRGKGYDFYFAIRNKLTDIINKIKNK